MKFIDELPGAARGSASTKWANIADQLRQNPGQWAEIERRPYNRYTAGGGSARYAARRLGLEFTQRKDGDEAVWYLRAPKEQA